LEYSRYLYQFAEFEMERLCGNLALGGDEPAQLIDAVEAGRHDGGQFVRDGDGELYDFVRKDVKVTLQ
jgi:hypothetical protein